MSGTSELVSSGAGAELAKVEELVAEEPTFGEQQTGKETTRAGLHTVVQQAKDTSLVSQEDDLLHPPGQESTSDNVYVDNLPQEDQFAQGEQAILANQQSTTVSVLEPTGVKDSKGSASSQNDVTPSNVEVPTSSNDSIGHQESSAASDLTSVPEQVSSESITFTDDSAVKPRQDSSVFVEEQSTPINKASVQAEHVSLEDDVSAARELTIAPSQDSNTPVEETSSGSGGTASAIHSSENLCSISDDKCTDKSPATNSVSDAQLVTRSTCCGEGGSSPADDAVVSVASADGARSRVTRSRNPDFSAKQRSFMKEYQRSVSRGGALSAAIVTEQGEKRAGSEEPATPPVGKRRRLAETPPTATYATPAASSHPRCAEDAFCWVCHRDGDLLRCGACPRAFHRKCGGLPAAAVADDAWRCAECRRGERAALALRQVPASRLTQLMKLAIGRLKGLPAAEPFVNPVDERTFPAYREVVAVPMDLTSMETRLASGLYSSPTAFVADCKWILHNCIVFNGTVNKLTTLARSLLRMCKWEMEEIETCPDCYGNAYSSDTWFTAACPYPHLLIWARLKGFPFWPAKAMKTRDGNVDCRFFGRHDRAWVPAKECYLFSKDPPVPPKSRSKSLDACLEELRDHVKNLEKRFGKYVYARNKTQFDPSRLPAHLKSTLPNYQALSPETHHAPSGGKRTSGGEATHRPRDAKRARLSGPAQPESGEAAVGPGSRESLAQPGSRETLSQHGNRVTSASPGSRETAASPGSRETAASPGSRETAASPGSRETSATPGSRETLAQSGSRDDTTEPVMIPARLAAAEPTVPTANAANSARVSDAPSEKGTAAGEGGPAGIGPTAHTNDKAVPGNKASIEIQPAPSDQKTTSSKPAQSATSKPKPHSNRSSNDSQQPAASTVNPGSGEKAPSNGKVASDNEKVSPPESPVLSKGPAVVDKVVKNGKRASVENSGTVRKAEPVKRSDSGAENSAKLSAIVKSTRRSSGTNGPKATATASAGKTESTERLVRVETPASAKIPAPAKRPVKEKSVDPTKNNEVNNAKASKPQQTKPDLKSMTPVVRVIKTEPPEVAPVTSSAAAAVPTVTTAAGSSPAATQPRPSWNGRNKTARKSLSGASISSVAARLSSSRAAAVSTSAAAAAAVVRRPPGSQTVVVPVSSRPQQTPGVVVFSRDPMASATATVSFSTSAQVSTQPLRPRIWTSAPVRAPAPSASTTSPPVVMARRDAARLMLPRTGIYIPAGARQPAPMMVMQNGVVTVSTAGGAAEVGPVSSEIDRQALHLTEMLREGVERYLRDRAAAGDSRASTTSLELAIEKREWKHKAEISELNRKHEEQLAAVMSSAELEQKRALNRQALSHAADRREWERLTEQKVAETKRKQWCAACGKEAIFYCCWNTSYCDFPCQEAQWPKHMLTCANQQAGGVQDGCGDGRPH